MDISTLFGYILLLDWFGLIIANLIKIIFGILIKIFNFLQYDMRHICYTIIQSGLTEIHASAFLHKRTLFMSTPRKAKLPFFSWYVWNMVLPVSHQNMLLLFHSWKWWYFYDHRSIICGNNNMLQHVAIAPSPALLLWETDCVACWCQAL